jgi:hypothetical protein
MRINQNDYCISLNQFLNNCTEQEKQQIKEMPILFLIIYTLIFNIFISLFGADND